MVTRPRSKGPGRAAHDAFHAVTDRRRRPVKGCPHTAHCVDDLWSQGAGHLVPRLWRTQLIDAQACGERHADPRHLLHLCERLGPAQDRRRAMERDPGERRDRDSGDVGFVDRSGLRVRVGDADDACGADCVSPTQRFGSERARTNEPSGHLRVRQRVFNRAAPLSDGVGRAGSSDRGGRGEEHDGLHPGGGRRADKPVDAVRLGVQEDLAHARECCGQGLGASEIGHDNGHGRRQAGRVRGPAGGAHLHSGGNELVEDGPAHMATRSGHKNRDGASFSCSPIVSRHLSA